MAGGDAAAAAAVAVGGDSAAHWSWSRVNCSTAGNFHDAANASASGAESGAAIATVVAVAGAVAAVADVGCDGGGGGVAAAARPVPTWVLEAESWDIREATELAMQLSPKDLPHYYCYYCSPLR